MGRNKVFHAEKHSVSQLMTMLKHFFDGVKCPLFEPKYAMTLLCSYMTFNCIVYHAYIQLIIRIMTL